MRTALFCIITFTRCVITQKSAVLKTDAVWNLLAKGTRIFLCGLGTTSIPGIIENRKKL
jgi:hypothetical protein